MHELFENYKPVDCSFVDQIEAVATKRREGIIEYFSEGGRKSLVTGTVTNWINEKGIEYLITDSNHKIRLDRIIKLFDIPGPAGTEKA